MARLWRNGSPDMIVAMYPTPSKRDKNPFLSMLVEGLRQNGVNCYSIMACFFHLPKALHVHWLEQVTWGRITHVLPFISVLKAGAVITAARVMSQRRRPIVWTVHNLQPHEALAGYRAAAFHLMRKHFLPLVTDVVVMSRSAIEQVRSNYPEIATARFSCIPHMSYRAYYGALGVSMNNKPNNRIAPKIIMAGLMRPYKGVVEAIETMKECEEDFEFHVLGRATDSYRKKIELTVGRDRRFILQFREHSDKEFAERLQDADLALFNFSRILNSGSVLAALSVGTPVLCPSDGALAELGILMGPSWVQLFRPPLQGQDVLDFARTAKFLDRQHPPIEPLDPRQTALAYSEVYAH